MDFDQIQAFIHIVEKGSFSKAAEKMYISQPTISERIRTLEKDLGVALLDRTGRKVQLTPQGRTFLPYAEACINSLLEGKNKIQSERDCLNIKIGLDQPFSSHVILSHLLRNLYREFPDLTIHVYRKHSSAEIMDLLKQSKIDLAFTNIPVKHEDFIQCAPLYQERLVFISNPDHPLAERSSVNASDLKHYKFVILDQRNNMSKILQAFLNSHQITMQTSLIEINSIVVIKELLRAEPMLTLLPEHIVADELKNGSLIEIPFDPSPEPLENCLVYSNNFQRLDLVEFIKQETKNILV